MVELSEASEKNGLSEMSLEEINAEIEATRNEWKAVEDLYGSYEVLTDEIRSFLENVIEDGNYEELYATARRHEAENKENLLEYQEEKPGVIDEDNVNDIVEALRRKKKNQKSTVI
ncbi:MAG: hypothetical protein K6G27_14390 [Lachnospiraceae bacterium]|nr:hypothetical protein [Lachnospiraceae bacterium]